MIWNGSQSEMSVARDYGIMKAQKLRFNPCQRIDYEERYTAPFLPIGPLVATNALAGYSKRLANDLLVQLSEMTWWMLGMLRVVDL